MATPITLAQAIHQLDGAARALEGLCNDARLAEPNPLRFRALQTDAKAVQACAFLLRTAAPFCGIALTDEQQRQLADVEERAGDLVDTFGWGAEPAALAPRLAEIQG